MAEPWEPLVDEPTRAFEAFTRYRDLTPSHRSIQNAAARACGLPMPPDVGSLSVEDRRALEARKRAYERWSSLHSWVIRAKEWDAYQDTERLAARDVNISSMIDRQAELGRILQARAMKSLSEIDAKRNGVLARGDRVVLAFAIEGARLERMAYGLAVEDTTVETGLSQEETRVALESDPEVAAAMAKLVLARSRADRRRGVLPEAIRELGGGA